MKSAPKSKFSPNNREGLTPLHLAALASDTRKVSALIKQGTKEELFFQDQLGNTALHYAVISDDGINDGFKIALKLIAAGDISEVMTQGEEGKTILHLMDKRDSYGGEDFKVNFKKIITEILGKEGVTPKILSVKDDDGNTPLMQFIKVGYVNTALKILDRLGDHPKGLLDKNTAGENALSLALENQVRVARKNRICGETKKDKYQPLIDRLLEASTPKELGKFDGEPGMVMNHNTETRMPCYQHSSLLYLASCNRNFGVVAKLAEKLTKKEVQKIKNMREIVRFVLSKSDGTTIRPLPNFPSSGSDYIFIRDIFENLAEKMSWKQLDECSDVSDVFEDKLEKVEASFLSRADKLLAGSTQREAPEVQGRNRRRG